MKIEKCEPGYISHNKKINILWLIGFVLIAIGIFLIGYLWMHTRANIFTVLAVLMVLPAAKRVVALVVMMPRKEIDRKRYDEMKDLAGDSVLFTDYVFTSTEKIMHLDFLLIRAGHVLAVPAKSVQDIEYMKKYLTDSVHKIVPDYPVEVFDRDEEMQEALKALEQSETLDDSEVLEHPLALEDQEALERQETDVEKEDRLLEYLRSLAV